MLGIVENFKDLRKNLGALIQKSGYKNSFIAEKLGIPAPNFSVKKKRGSWTVEEVEKILKIIDTEDLHDYYLGKIMETVESENEYMTANEFKEAMKWK